MTTILSCCITVLTAILASTAASAADWPQWRGPDRSGIAPSSPALTTNWPATGPALVWKSEKIPTYEEGGIGSVAVSNGLAVVYSNWKYKDPGTAGDKANDTIFCFNAANGDVKWKAQFPGQPTGWFTSATPLIVGDRCYQLASGDFYCLSMKDGSFVWKAKVDVVGGSSSSALFINGKIIVVAGKLIAYDTTGKTLWSQPAVSHTHTSPVTWTNGGKTFVICSGSVNDLICVDPADGSVVWRTSPGANNSTPVISGDYAVALGEGPGLQAFRLARDKVEKVWNFRFDDRGSSPIVADGHVYIVAGRFDGKAVCLKLETGQVVWEGKIPGGAEVGSPILADGKLIALVNSGTELWMMRAGPTAFEVLAKAKIPGANGSSPAIADGKLYLRTTEGVACYDLTQSAEKPTPAPAK